MEHPSSRLREVWRNYILSSVFRAQQPRRFNGIWGADFGTFLRWVMQQDPLGCDMLVRPQWAMIPADAQLVRVPSLVRERSRCALDLAAVIYAGDFPLWERAAELDAAPGIAYLRGDDPADG